ncbi:MAG TPA: hypothetical protein VKW06_14600 [Candidatus Angelobacter sp.]|nr:hypothetical protein [Candidatus Angelobacter sp.]
MATDEEIRLLCARVVKASGKEFDAAIAELLSAIEKRLSERQDARAKRGS